MKEIVRRPARLLLIFALAVWTAACVIADKPDIALEARKTFRLTRVDVEFDGAAVVHVSDLQDEAQAKGLDVAATAAYQRERLKPLIASQFLATAGARMAGAQPVTVKLTINKFFIPGPFATLALGGNRDMLGGIDLVDARTGQILSRVPPGRITVTRARLGGALGLAVLAVQNHPNEQKIRDLVDLFAQDYADWLLSP